MDNSKLLAFDYFLYQLLNWYDEVFGKTIENDLGTLKVLKLLFFTTAIGENKDSHGLLLDRVFNRFYAMPYGHVEGDVYDFIKEKRINFSVNNYKTTTPETDIDFSTLDETIQDQINANIKNLKETNLNLIKMNSFDLVELSHSWYSWRHYFSMAKSKGVYSELIPNGVIKNEKKFFHL